MINYVNGLGHAIDAKGRTIPANPREMPAKAFYDHFVAPSAGEHSLSAGSGKLTINSLFRVDDNFLE
jgi:hypothetical protein